MSGRVVRREQARRDLVRHAAYLAEHAGLETAGRFLDEVEAACAQLAKTPELGARRKFAHESLANVRMWPLRTFAEYLLFYEPISDGIRLIRVIHAKRDYRRVMK